MYQGHTVGYWRQHEVCVNRVAAVATKHGWNGVEDSMLEEFIENRLKRVAELEKELKESETRGYRQGMADSVVAGLGPAVPSRPVGKPDVARGLYAKFSVVRTDGSSAVGGKHHNCEYFVLDLTHDPFAPAAIRAYAKVCRDKFPKLAEDLLAKFPEPVTQEPAPSPEADVEKATKLIKDWLCSRPYPHSAEHAEHQLAVTAEWQQLRSMIASALTEERQQARKAAEDEFCS